MAKKLKAGPSQKARKLQPAKVGGVSRCHRFIGVSLGGGKQDKACIAVVEYYPDHHKVFLSSLQEKIKSEGEISADLKIHEFISKYDAVDFVAFDVPLHLPLCLSCTLVCPGYESCRVEHIRWMWKRALERNKKKRPQKLFTPYTQRSVEFILNADLEEPFLVPHTLGANTAPLTARAHFIKRRLNVPVMEVSPRLSIWRIGRSLKVAKSQLRFYKHAVSGAESRSLILAELNRANIAFLYQQDIKSMTENNHAFEAFICALTAFLKFQNQTEKPPKDFPSEEGWVDFPVTSIDWKV